jgi:RHS repeat-associated protein
VAPATSDQRTKFATYYRDSAGLDYAGQRYYSNVTGRFLTPDPAGFSAANPNNPATWNSYAYVHGDPVNFNDSTGDGECAVGEPVPCTETVTGDAADGMLYPWNPVASLVSPAWVAMNYYDVHGIPTPAELYHQELNTVQRAQAVMAIQNLGSGCDHALQDVGINTSSLAAVASGIEFFSTYYGEGGLQVRNISGYTNPVHPNQTLSQYLGSGRAATLPLPNGTASNDVVLGPLYFTQTGYGSDLASSQNITLVHETLHVMTGLGDSALVDKLGFGNLPQNAASTAISNWLATDCPKVN